MERVFMKSRLGLSVYLCKHLKERKNADVNPLSKLLCAFYSCDSDSEKTTTNIDNLLRLLSLLLGKNI